MFGKLFKKTDYKMLLENGAVIIDVRSPQEYSGGAIPGSENIPLGSLASKTKQIKSLGVPVICVCASGMRSGAAKSNIGWKVKWFLSLNCYFVGSLGIGNYHAVEKESAYHS